MRTLVLLDDYMPILRATARVLKGRKVHTATTADVACRLVESEKPDLFVVDHVLGPHDPSGLEVIAHARRTCPNTRLALYSGELDFELAIAALEAGADHAFPKTVDLRYIVARFEGHPCDESTFMTLDQVMHEHVKRAVTASDGNLTQAAKKTGRSRETVRKMIGGRAKR